MSHVIGSQSTQLEAVTWGIPVSTTRFQRRNCEAHPDTLAGDGMNTGNVNLKFQIGERTLYDVRVRLCCQTFSLDEILSGANKGIPFVVSDVQGVSIRSVPVRQVAQVRSACPNFLFHEQQRYCRHYIRLDGTFEDYLGKLSKKTRSTLKRKVRKWRDLTGGKVDVREYRTAEDLQTFHKCAREISHKTYQERLLDAGLPDTERHMEDMLQRAAHGTVRAYLLFCGETPVSYLYLPINDGCLIYAYLGYDPAFSAHSPGTVLQMEVLDRLFAEQRFRLFDFTEGEGQHKRMFGTDYVECCDLLLLTPTVRTRLLLVALRSFNGTVKTISAVTERIGVKSRLRRFLRRAA